MKLTKQEIEIIKKLPPFSAKVAELSMMIPKGKVTTYGRLAIASGARAPKLAQSITSILGKAYEKGLVRIPFHRIVYSDGRVWMNSEYEEKRRELYNVEKIEIDEKGKIKNFDKKLFEYK